MKCHFCDHERVHKHGKTKKGVERFKCPACGNTFTATFDTLYSRRQVSEPEVHPILQSHQEGVSIRGISRVSQRLIDTVTGMIQRASAKAQRVHNQEVSPVESEVTLAVSAQQRAADEMWSFVEKNKRIVSLKMN
jgi:transposase-like protein